MLFLWLYIPFIYKLVDVGYAFFHNWYASELELYLILVNESEYYFVIWTLELFHSF